MFHRSAPPAHDYVVPCPRPTDAIGAALRGAYRDALSVPEPMATALRQLDRVDRG